MTQRSWALSQACALRVALLMASSVTSSMLVAPAVAADDTLQCAQDATWLDCFSRLRGAAATSEQAEEQKAQQSVQEAALTDVGDRAQNGLTSVLAAGAAGSKRTFLPLLLGALGVDGLTESSGNLSLALNPRPWSFGQLTGEVVAYQPEAFSQLAEAIPEADRQARVTTLENELSDFDDVGLSLRLVVRGRQGTIGRSLSDYDPEFGTTLYRLITKDIETQTVMSELALLNQKLQSSVAMGETPAETMDRNKAVAQELDALVASAALTTVQVSQQIQKTLTDTSYFALADLANNQPQLYFTGELRERAEIAGPDSWALGATYELGLGANLNTLRDHCAGKVDAAFVQCYSDYAKASEAALNSKERFKFELSFGESEAYTSPVPDIELELQRIESVKASIAYGRILRRDRAAKEASRLDVDATYEDVTDDSARQDRLVAIATFTERMTDDLAFSISAVWASKPEYRGDVDEEVTARAGLRYKIGEF